MIGQGLNVAITVIVAAVVVISIAVGAVNSCLASLPLLLLLLRTVVNARLAVCAAILHVQHPLLIVHRCWEIPD